MITGKRLKKGQKADCTYATPLAFIRGCCAKTKLPEKRTKLEIPSSWPSSDDSISTFLTGPRKVNGCPMRRINQTYLIATQTSIDVSGVKVPESINDEYFRRAKAVKAKKTEGDIFASK